ncbi:MAG: hypothetical protein MI725_10810, partial [Pirellulales bacterium]|nr:hypothetical protein [Pirellulales bacterium]
TRIRPHNQKVMSMEARCALAARSAVYSLVLLALLGVPAQGAGYRTANFTVDAPTPALAKEIGDMAEHWRRQLAQEWLGKQLPDWSRPCPIKARVGARLGAGGETSFVFDRGEVFGWRMQIQGSRERVLDSVLPHEVTHTIFASHFRQPLPRWADEGACTTVEHESEISKQENMLIDFLRTRRGIPFSNMFAMKEYPRDVLPLYAQGHSVAKFLIAQQGKRKFLAFLGDGMEDENWPRAVAQHYGYKDLLTMQNSWMSWIRAGRPQIQLASNTGQAGVRTASHEAPVVRGQDPASNGAKPQNWPAQNTAAPAQATSVYDTRAPRNGTIRR